MAKVYVEKARRVTADQFVIASTPWPPGVTQGATGPVYQYPSGIKVPIADTDWIATDERNGSVEVLTDAVFQDRYGAGPPT